MELKNLQYASGFINSHLYNGVNMCCAKGVHEKVFSALEKSGKNKNSKILVLGSGAGAFERRLLDNGYRNITSVDFIPENFKVSEIQVLELDLNLDFSSVGKFDIVIAIELIEHLENQFHFIRCVKKTMNADAIFYLSTPNVGNTFVRMRYFLLGNIYWFGRSELEGTGHINPIFKHILEFNLSQNNLKIQKYFGNINIWFKLFKNRNIFKRIAFFFMFIISFFMIKKNNFEINLFEIVNDDID